jgi:hypothetical protein
MLPRHHANPLSCRVYPVGGPAFRRLRQGREDPLPATAPWHQCFDPRYPEAAGHGADDNDALFRPIRNNRTGRTDKALDSDMVYRLGRAIHRRSASRSAPTRCCARRPPPIRLTTKPPSPKHVNGSATRIWPQFAFTITLSRGRSTARRLT